MMTGLWASGAENTITITCSVSNDIITVSGVTNLSGNRPLSVVVVNPTFLLSDLTNANAGTILNHSNTFLSQDGVISYSYKMPAGAPVGDYKAYVTSAQEDVSAESGFPYCDMNTLIDIFNNAALAEIPAAINDYAKYLDIDITGLYSNLSDKSQLYAALFNQTFTYSGGTEEIKQMFSKQLAVSSLKEGSTQTISAIMAELCKVSTSPFATIYNNFPSEYKSKVGATLLSTKAYTDFSSAELKFSEGVILALINQAGYPDNRQLITSTYKNDIGINSKIITNPDGLGETKIATIMKAVATESFVTYAALKSYIITLENSTPDSGGSGFGGGGVGSGGGGGGVSAPVGQLNVYGNEIVPQISFSDLGNAEWAIESITALQKAGIISGVGNNLFMPDNQVTREEFVKMLVLALKLPLYDGDTEFSDVNRSEWYFPYIGAAYNAGLLNGYPDGSFGIGDKISRQDIAVLIHRAVLRYNLNIQAVNTAVSFKDDDLIADYAKMAVSSLQQAGIINGVGELMFAPLDNATRAMAAKLIYSIYSI